MRVGRVRAPPRRAAQVHVRLGPVARRAVGGLGHAFACFYLCGRIAAVCDAALDCCCCHFLVTAPPVAAQSAKNCAAVPELLLPLILLHASVTETPTHRCKRPQPGKLVHHHASTRQRRFPGTLDAPRTRPGSTRRESIMRNPHVWKKRWASTRAFCVPTDVRQSRLHTNRSRRRRRDFCSRPRAAPRRHHCRARGPEGHRRQDV